MPAPPASRARLCRREAADRSGDASGAAARRGRPLRCRGRSGLRPWSARACRSRPAWRSSSPASTATRPRSVMRSGRSQGCRPGFAVADLATAPIPACDTVLAHRCPVPAAGAGSSALLERVAMAARSRVLIRAFDPGRGWRARLGLAMEGLAGRSAADRAAIEPLPLQVTRGTLRGGRLQRFGHPLLGRHPLPNVLLVAERASP